MAAASRLASSASDSAPRTFAGYAIPKLVDSFHVTTYGESSEANLEVVRMVLSILSAEAGVCPGMGAGAN